MYASYALYCSHNPIPDRCINSSGVLRYRTGRGWVSELTRGHGRENIKEILDVCVGAGPLSGGDDEARPTRIEYGVPDLRSAGASILARLHGSQVSTQRMIRLSPFQVCIILIILPIDHFNC